MPFFLTGNEADIHFTADELAHMNRRYDNLIEDIEPVNEDEGQTEETRSEEIATLADEIRSDMEAATNEEKAFLEYLVTNDGDDTAWFDDFRDADYKFYGYGTVLRQGSAEYAVIPECDIEDVFKVYIREYVDECVLPGKDDTAQRYFDYEAFQHDVECESGYGIMSSYDGNYEEFTVNDETYYIFRLN
jgi:hypothetical protein